MSHARRIAFVCPRFADGPTVGGAETLLKNLAIHGVEAGLDVTFLTTCARNHFTWANEIPAGSRSVDGMTVHFFPVDTSRNIEEFLRIQDRISRGIRVGAEEEESWLRHNVNSQALYAHLREQGATYDRIIAGPYLFGLVHAAALIHPQRTLLVPCLHDEPFAYLDVFRDLFQRVGGLMFNTEPESDLAVRLYDLPADKGRVVGMGMDSFDADPRASARTRGLDAPYVIYSGRREPLKGTPLLMDYIRTFRERTTRDIKFVLTGTGPIDVPASMTPHVLDLGFVSETEKHAAMAGALAFCHPSVNESLGIVLLESWMAGTPAVVHAGSAVLKHQCRQSRGGLWFRSYPDFEEAIRLLMDHPELRRSMGESARRYVLREYSWETIGKRFLNALDV